MENDDSKSKKSIDERAVDTFERVASTAERVGIPVATFTIGACILAVSAYYANNQESNPFLVWTGVGLILSSLMTYIWLTERSTIKVQTPPVSTSKELNDIMEWMKNEITTQNKWLRENVDNNAVTTTNHTSNCHNTYIANEDEQKSTDVEKVSN